ncbi:MAG: hypothetical protein SGCHY_000320 [Lobulomycetales sp.]
MPKSPEADVLFTTHERIERVLPHGRIGDSFPRMMAGVDATMPQRQKLRQKKPAGSFTLGCIDEAEEEEAEFTHIAATGEKKKRYHAEDGDLFPQLGGPGPLRNRNIQQVNESWQNDSCKLDALASSSRAESFPRLSKNTSNEVLQGGRKVAFEQIESAPEENETGNKVCSLQQARTEHGGGGSPRIC